MAASLNSNANVVASDGALNNLCDRDPIYDADCGADSFATENNGTAKFMGNTGGALGGSNSGDTGDNTAATSSSCTGGSGVISGANLTTSGGETLNESCNNLNDFGAACSGLSSGKFDFHTMKATNNQKTSRIELPRSELLKMLFYLEGELQARDVVIAALRNERVKHLITQLRSNPIGTNDPHAAMFRDKIALSGNLISRQSSTIAVQAEMEVRLIIEQQMESLYQMVHKQRATHVRMVGILTESLDNNQRMLQELEEEKRKHEHDTAQGDDITYGLEMERTKLRQELETERQQVKKLEKDLKKLQETLDFERSRQKQIVLLLIAERKKILMKYIEEGKRSEDLAQILSEEKQRSDSIAEGLEEESKKSLRMEAEIEKQACAFDGERKSMKLILAKDEQRIKELENQLTQLKTENDALRKHYQQQQQQQQQQHQQNPALTSAVPLRLQQATQNVAITNLQTKSSARPLNDDCGSLVVNIAKIVQPTATVSSVPVSGPTTGIARSISPGQSLRSSATGVVAPGFTLGNSILNDQQQNINSNTPIQTNTTSSVSATPLSLLTSATQTSALSQSAATNATPSVKHLSSSTTLSGTGNAPAVGHIGGVASGGATQISMAAMQRVGLAPAIGGGGKFSTSSALCSSSSSSSAAAAAASNADKILPSNATSLASSASAAVGVIQNNVNVATVIGSGIGSTSTQATRGVPPPIPPNKPVVPPKREPSLSRLPSVVVNSATAAAIAAAAASATTSSSPVLLPLSSSSSSAIGSSVSGGGVGGGGGGAVTQAVTNVSATTVANSK